MTNLFSFSKKCHFYIRTKSLDSLSSINNSIKITGFSLNKLNSFSSSSKNWTKILKSQQWIEYICLQLHIQFGKDSAIAYSNCCYGVQNPLVKTTTGYSDISAKWSKGWSKNFQLCQSLVSVSVTVLRFSIKARFIMFLTPMLCFDF